MNIKLIIDQLVHTDSLEDWAKKTADLSNHDQKIAFEAAKPRWVERMIKDGKLLLHPRVITELRSLNWIPDETHQRMIWASILASLEGENSKDDFKRIKAKLVRKHGHEWWEDVYRRVRPAYAAKERIKNLCQGKSPALNVLAQHSIFIASALHDQRCQALKMIPKE